MAFCSGSAVGKTLIEWTFDKPKDLQGWQPNGELKEVAVTHGVLKCRAVGRDPILELRPQLDFAASPRQLVEIRLKADADGMAQLFWGSTSSGIYHGFSEENSLKFRVCGDGEWRVYRFLPCWHTEGRIVRLRFDLFDGAQFELDRIRIVQLEATTAARTDLWSGWQWLETSTSREASSWSGKKVHAVATGMLLSPPLQLDADQQTLATIRLAVSRGNYATFFFIKEAQTGLQRLTFPIIADGEEHTYHLDLLANTNWGGRVIALGLQPSDATSVTIRLRLLEVHAAEQTPPRLAVSFFSLEDALPRAQVPSKLLAVVRNSGGRTATNIIAKLRLPAGVTLLGGLAEQRFERLGLAEDARFEWTVQATRPLDGNMRLALTAANADKVNLSTPVRFTARLSPADKDYVPEPTPVRGQFEVGAYYYPGWKSAGSWQYLQDFPERKPVLGWYREGEPEVADWHIKWAVEHGITFFAYDWYWSQGNRSAEHALHDGYFKARYRHLLKFCLLWANHNPPNSSSHEDCIAVTRYWIENYFRRPEHLTVAGKPAVIIYSPERLTEDLGSANVKRALDAMREECRRAGFKGLYLTACAGDAGIAQTAAAEGYDAITAYTWPFSGMAGDELLAPFETLVPAYRRKWENLLTQSPIPQMPLLVCGGWDSRPWHGDHWLVRFGRTPELFKRHLLDAKQFLETAMPQSQSPKMILVEAWNEWAEGSYIEPHQQFGFGYLDAIRDVFTEVAKTHADMTPADVGVGPYDAEASAPATKTAWEFELDHEGWGTQQLSELTVTHGRFSGRTIGNVPLFFSPPMQARADRFSTVILRMKLTRVDSSAPAFTDSAQLIWSTTGLPRADDGKFQFPVKGDGQWHEYRLPVSQNARWRAVVKRLRLSPCSQAGVNVDLDFVRLTE